MKKVILALVVAVSLISCNNDDCVVSDCSYVSSVHKYDYTQDGVHRLYSEICLTSLNTDEVRCFEIQGVDTSEYPIGKKICQ